MPLVSMLSTPRHLFTLTVNVFKLVQTLLVNVPVTVKMLDTVGDNAAVLPVTVVVDQL